MIKFISKLKGAKVLLYQERAIVGTVERVLIDPKDGEFVGLVVNPTHQKGHSYIPTNEIKGFGEGFLLVEGLSSLSEEDDVLKIQKVLKIEPRLIGSSVYTESGNYLGKVEDVTLDLRVNTIKKIYVAWPFSLNFLGQEKIIDKKQIIKIETKKILVKDLKTAKKIDILAPLKTPAGE